MLFDASISGCPAIGVPTSISSFLKKFKSFLNISYCSFLSPGSSKKIYFLNLTSKHVLAEAFGPGLIVKTYDSLLKGPGFITRHHILDGYQNLASNVTCRTLDRMQRLMVGCFFLFFFYVRPSDFLQSI